MISIIFRLIVSSGSGENNEGEFEMNRALWRARLQSFCYNICIFPFGQKKLQKQVKLVDDLLSATG